MQKVGKFLSMTKVVVDVTKEWASQITANYDLSSMSHLQSHKHHIITGGKGNSISILYAWKGLKIWSIILRVILKENLIATCNHWIFCVRKLFAGIGI